MIDQEIWRQGLTPPDYERIYTPVRNIIIHHTAGSNTDTNYIQVVRSHYIYHTEVRGWSDIGYNYLIAQDGSLFKGRDPGELEQDYVMGAHFCASNTGTLGISLLGTYSEILPSDTALHSLYALLAWKTGKDSLDPLGSAAHPLNRDLPVIAGHRDGCATECPGQMFYNTLPEVRQEVYEIFLDCNYAVKPLIVNGTIDTNYRLSLEGDELTVWGDFIPGDIIWVSDLTGKKILQKEIGHHSAQARLEIPSGMKQLYIVSFIRNNTLISRLVTEN